MSDKLRLLLVEDSDDDAQLVLRELNKGGFEVYSERVETPSELRETLARVFWDVVICDYSLPQFTALDAIPIIKESGQDTSIIIISGTMGEESAVTALINGAHDFITKGNMVRLVPAIRRELREAVIRRQHRDAQLALMKSEERFRSWIEYSSDLVTVTDQQGRIEFESHSSERLLGYSPDELIGRNILELVHPKDHRPLSALIQPDRGDAEGIISAEFRLHHRDGGWCDFEGIRRTYVDEAGRITLLINSRDITERKQRERELEAIAALTAALRTADTLDELLALLLDDTLSLLEVQAGTIWLYDPLTGEVQRSTQRGQLDGLPAEAQRGLEMGKLLMEKRGMVLIPEIQSASALAGTDRSGLPEGVGAAGVPLRASDNIIGGMFVFFKSLGELASGGRRVLNALSEIGGSSIHRVMLYEQSLKQLEQLAALRSIDIAISGSLDLGLTLHTILDQVIKQLRIDAADIILLAPDGSTLKNSFARGFHTRNANLAGTHLDATYAGKAVLDRRAVFLEDIASAVPAFSRRELVSQEGFKAYGAIPLMAKGRVQGVLEIFTRSPLNTSAEWRQFLEALAGQAAIAIDNLSLFQELQESNYELAMAYDATIEGWSHALDLRDRETEGHTLRVTEMSVKLAQAMEMPEEDLVQLRRGALLHDIGKMGVPDRILHKKGPLNADEWEIMRKHPEYAYQMLTPISYLRKAIDIPYCHHERWDGAGYPRGLKGELIPLPARIFAVVDVWDALTSNRPYRDALTDRKALEYIRLQSGKHFDPRIVEDFLVQMGQL